MWEPILAGRIHLVTQPAAPSRSYSDDPLEGLSGDQLERAPLVTRIVEAIESLNREETSSVVALTGPWGSGKTSVLGAVEEALGNRGVVVCTYTPWAFTSLDTAVRGFYSELREAFPEGADGSRRIRDAISGVIARTSNYGKFARVFGIEGDEVMNAAAEAIAGDRSPDMVRKELTQLLKDQARRICVVIDDVDRLEPDELLLTFRLVRFLGRLPCVNYLLCFDEETLSDVLTRTGLVGDSVSRARAYLEKMVQVRIDIPPLNAAQSVAMLNCQLDPVLERHKIEWTEDFGYRFGELWQRCLKLYLDQPRSIKRLAVQADVGWAQIVGEADPVDYLIATFLRTFEPALFEEIARRRDELVDPWVYQWQHKESKERVDSWRKLVTALGVQHPDGILWILKETFPSLSDSAPAPAELRRNQRFGSVDYFNRFVSVGLQKDDLSDVQIRSAIEALSAAEPDNEPLWRLGESDLEGTVLRIESISPQGLPAGALDWLARVYPRAAADRAKRSLGGVAASSVLRIARATLLALTPSESVACVKHLLDDAQTLYLGAVLIQEASASEQSPVALKGLVELSENGVDSIQQYLLALSTRVRLSELQDGELVAYFHLLYDLSGRDRVRDFAWSLIEGDNSRWDLGDVLAALVSIGERIGDHNRQVLAGLNRNTVDAYLGLAEVERKMVSTPSAGALDDEDTSWESRKAHAFAAL